MCVLEGAAVGLLHLPVSTPEKTSIMMARPEPLGPPMGSMTPSRALLGSSVGLPVESDLSVSSLFPQPESCCFLSLAWEFVQYLSVMDDRMPVSLHKQESRTFRPSFQEPAFTNPSSSHNQREPDKHPLETKNPREIE